MTTHPATATLPHTGLQVPVRHPHVVSMSSLPMPNGTALVALVRHDDRDIGTIEDSANGGGMWFRHTEAALGPLWLDEFAALCRHHGQPVTRSQLMNLLVEEWQVADHLLRAIAEGQTLARFMLHGGTHLTLPVRMFIPPQEADLTELVAVAEITAALAEVADDPGGHWQIWTGTTWQQVTWTAPAEPGDDPDPRQDETDPD